MIEFLFCMVVGLSDHQMVIAQCGAGTQELKFRLAGVDIPAQDEPFGEEAGHFVSQLLYKQHVRLECRDMMDSDHRQTVVVDKALKVCTAWVAPQSTPQGFKTLDVGMALLTIGLARYQTQHAHYLSEQEQGQYAFAQEEAHAKGVGLWVEK